MHKSREDKVIDILRGNPALKTVRRAAYEMVVYVGAGEYTIQINNRVVGAQAGTEADARADASQRAAKLRSTTGKTVDVLVY